MKPAKKRTANFSDSVLRHLNAYAVAASAAGVSALAVAPADAQVIYTPTRVQLSQGGLSVYELNPAGNKTAPFVIYDGFTSPGAYWDVLSFNPKSSGARFVQGPGTSWSIAPLKAGALIGSKRQWGNSIRGLIATYGPYGGGTYKNHDGFAFGKFAYIGFKFQIVGEIHYGWARVEVLFDKKTPKRRLHLLLTGYAYEATVNKPIKAGQISDDEGDSTAGRGEGFEPSLGWLALGSLKNRTD